MAYIQDLDPDVLCLQEVVHTPAAPKPWLLYRDDEAELPQRANFYSDMRDALPNHSAYFAPAAQGALWDGDQAFASQWGLATFVRQTIPVIGQAQDFVHGVFSPDGFGDHPRSRTAHAVRLYDMPSLGPVTIAHMHGLRDLGGKYDTPARLAQARKLRALVEQTAESGDRLVVCGDFNVRPESETFDVLSAIGLTDLVTKCGFKSTRTSFYNKPVRYADYMLTNAHVAVSSFTVVEDPQVSDHCPLLLEIG
ncbi:endonuclease/exonuclease/phosphatase family protein [Nisaea sp.]|uniref:endonuclease/exonuclease/phosphatase family protein n=1 Tax=Nisaea sp. TaxID=2024842 RepID=UPI0032677A1C